MLKTLDQFKNDRPEQVKMAETIIGNISNGAKTICVSAPVKSGKREIVEIMQLISNINIKVPVYFCTSLNRIDITNQFLELQNYGIEFPKDIDGKPTSICSKDIVKSVKDKFKWFSDTGNAPIIVLDESDYGTGRSQTLEEIYKTALEFKFPIVHFSATNLELQLSKTMKKDGAITLPPYTPAPTYRGASHFLDNNLVHDSFSFYEYGNITESGWNLIDKWLKTDKPISVLRLSGNGDFKKLQDDKINRINLAEKSIELVFVDQKKSMKWDSDDEWGIYVKLFNKTRVRKLIIINQVCSRSTQVGFHEYIYFWHDHRGANSAYNTMAQAFLRVAHYVKNPNDPPHLINLYCDKSVIELAAGRLTPDEWSEYNDKKLSSRVQKSKTISEIDPKFLIIKDFISVKDLLNYCKSIGYKPRLDFEKDNLGRLLGTRRNAKNVLLTRDQIYNDISFGMEIKKKNCRVTPWFDELTNTQCYTVVHFTDDAKFENAKLNIKVNAKTSSNSIFS